MKKALAIILTLALCLSVMVGCGASSSQATGTSGTTAAQKTDMLLWMPPFGTGDSLDKEFWTNALAPWAEENNVNLSIEITPWGGYEEKYLTGFSSGEVDVGYMYQEMFNDFIEMGALADIDTYFTAEEKSSYLYYEKGNMKGGQYALPFIVGNARITYFNMDMLEKAGVTELPATWEELEATAIKVKDANLENVIPFAQEWADPAIGALNNIFYPYLWQAGGDIYNEDGTKVALTDNDAAVKAAQFIYDLKFKDGVITDECLALSEADVKEKFKAGEVAIATMAATRGQELTDAGINWSFIPSLENETKAIWVASDSLIMNSACENKELAASLMKYITSAKVMSGFHTELSGFPPITTDEEYNDNPAFKDMYENDTEYFHTLPVANGAFKVMDTLYKNLQLMMLGDLTPEEAIQKTADYSNSVS